jgi:hypothetical protein
MSYPASYGRTTVHTVRRRQFDVWNEVPLVPQLTGMSCWAAAAAMVVGWRDRMLVDPQAVANGAGGWEAYRDGLHPDDISDLARAWGLVIEPSLPRTVEGVRSLLERIGPLWVGEASPGLHSIVVTGAHGDGTEEGTFVRINDPWPIGRGERYAVSFREFVRNFDAATDAVGAHAQILHAGGRSHGSSRRAEAEQHVRTTVTVPDHEGNDMHTTQTTHQPAIGRHGRAHTLSTATVPAGEIYLSTSTFASDPLSSHGGNGENLFVRWTDLGRDVRNIDVVLHLHGYGDVPSDRAFLEQKVQASGADIAGRSRPTLVLIPRGRKISAAETQESPSASPNRYTFPGLRGDGLEALVAHALRWVTTELLERTDGSVPAVDRLIFTAHSGGGIALNALLRDHARRRVCDPHEVQLFDATYGRHDGILSWLSARVRADRSVEPTKLREHMRGAGGGIRVIHRDGPTSPGAQAIARTLSDADLVGGAPHLAPWYRVEQTHVAHVLTARQYGPTLLMDLASDLEVTAPTAGEPLYYERYGTPLALFDRYRAMAPTAEEALGREGPGPLSHRQRIAEALVDQSSTQTEQSQAVRRNIAQSLGNAETGMRYHLVHNDSNRVNFGIGSWTGSRIADLLDTYETVARERNATQRLYRTFGDQAAFVDLRARFRRDGAQTVINQAERTALENLGRDADLQEAQVRHLADDIAGSLNAIGTQPPWYPYIDAGMGAISEVAAHVLVHARHQSGNAGFVQVLQRTIAHFGGEADLGQRMVDGRVTERDVLEQVRDVIVSRVNQAARAGVRRRYDNLLQRYATSVLAYYFHPQN